MDAIASHGCPEVFGHLLNLQMELFEQEVFGPKVRLCDGLGEQQI
jgi:hypothetical protein